MEGQDSCCKGLLIVAELGLGPNSEPFPGSTGPKLHLFDIAPPLQYDLKPFATMSLAPYIDGVLHVKFLRPNAIEGIGSDELWAVASGGFATNVAGGVVLVNLTNIVRDYRSFGANLTVLRSSDVLVLSTPVLQPEGVIVDSSNSFVYVGGINSTSLGVINVTNPAAAALINVQADVGMQLVGAKMSDQPKWPEYSTVTRIDGDCSGCGNDDGIIFFASWGGKGKLIAVDTMGERNAAAPVVIGETEYWREASLRMANRVKLLFTTTQDGGQTHWAYDLALLPLETRIGGFAVVNISDISDRSNSTDISLPVLRTVHVPLYEIKESTNLNSKAYCLAVSSTRYVYLFIAETSTVFIYDLDAITQSPSSLENI